MAAQAGVPERLDAIETKVKTLTDVEARVKSLEQANDERLQLLHCIVEAVVGGYNRIPDSYVKTMKDWKAKS